MKICVFGAGSVGGHIATCLANGGVQVAVVARGEHLAAIRRNGISVLTPDGNRTARVAASDDAHDLGTQDAVVVAVKAPSIPSIAASLAPLLGAATPVVFAVNGIPWWYFQRHGGKFAGRQIPSLDPDQAITRAIDSRRVIGCVAYAPATGVATPTLDFLMALIKLRLPAAGLYYDAEPAGRLSQSAHHPPIPAAARNAR